MTFKLNISDEFFPALQYYCTLDDVLPETMIKDAILTYLVLKKEVEGGSKIILRKEENAPYETELTLTKGVN